MKKNIIRVIFIQAKATKKDPIPFDMQINKGCTTLVFNDINVLDKTDVPINGLHSMGVEDVSSFKDQLVKMRELCKNCVEKAALEDDLIMENAEFTFYYDCEKNRIGVDPNSLSKYLK